MPRPALQICFHDHCFDGVASAASFLRFYRERVKPLAADAVALRGLAHQAGALFTDETFAGEENAVVDFRYSTDPRLTWWFDHHQSAFESAAQEAAFRADASGRKFWDPAAKSCTKFLARVCAERFAFDPEPLRELIDWAEVIDGALFPDARTAVELSHPAMQLMLLIEASKDGALCPRLIRALADRPLAEVLREPWVTGSLGPLLARHREIVRAVSGRLEVSGGVAFFDVADLGLDNVNKFIAYHQDAGALYTVSVTCSSSRSAPRAAKTNVAFVRASGDVSIHASAAASSPVIAEARNGSSPYVSSTRPHLGSDAMFTTGDRTWRTPRLRVSSAIAPATRSMSAVSQPAARPIAAGKTVAPSREAS